MASIAPPEHADPAAQASRKPGLLPDDGEMRRVLNVRLLIVTVIVLAVLIPSAYFWHAFQAKRVAGAFLDHAKTLEEEGKMGQAVVYTAKYLRVHPDDHQTRYHLAEIYDDAAQDWRSKASAITHYRDFLATAPVTSTIADAEEREAMAQAIEDSRCRVAEILVDGSVRRFREAEEAADELLAQDEEHPVGLKVQALAMYGRWEEGVPEAKPIRQIVKLMIAANKKTPEDISLALNLATYFRNKSTKGTREERAELADGVIDAMVDSNDGSADALLTRAKYRLEFSLEGATEDLKNAEMLESSRFDILLTSALEAYKSGVEAVQGNRTDEATRAIHLALERFEKVIAAAPKNVEGYYWAGICQQLLSKPGRAIDIWREGLSNVPVDSPTTIRIHLRLAETFLDLDDRLEEADSAITALEQILDKTGQRLKSGHKETAGYAVEYFRGKWHILRDEYQHGVRRLRPVLSAGPRANLTPKQDIDARTQIARAYAGLEQWDNAARWFEDAIRILSRYQTRTPDLLKRHLFAAESYGKAGQLDGAARHYAKALEYPKALDEKRWLTAVQVLIQHQAGLPEDERDWGVIEQHMERPPAKLRSSWTLKLLMAEISLAKGGERAVDQATDLLRRAARQAPESEELYRRLAHAYQRFGNTEQEQLALAKYAELAGNTERRYLTLAEIHASGKRFDEAGQTLREGIENLPEDKHASLRHALQRLNLRQGDVEEAAREFEKLYEADPSNPAYLSELAELALQRRDDKALERWEAALKQAEGDDGVLWQYFRGRRLLAASRRVEPNVLAEVEQLLSAIEQKRPDWAEGRLLRGRLALHRNRFEEAIDAYEQSLQLGDSRLSSHIQLITLLYRGGRIEDAERRLESVKDYIAVSPQLRYLQIDVAVAKEQKERALELAQDAVENEPKDVGAWVKLGETRELNGLISEAKDAFLNAWQLEPNRVQPWKSLYRFYAVHGRKDIAKEVLENPPRDPNVSPAELARHLADGYASLGQRKAARALYEEARKRTPDDIELLMRFAAFVVHDDRAEAGRIWHHVIELAPDSAHAKRNVARLLNGQGEWQEAVRLLENSEDVDDQRLLANLLVRRGAENRDRARRILEPIAQSAQVNASDYRTLAIIYETNGNLLSAQRQYQELIAGSKSDVQHLHAYIDYLLRHKETRMAARVLEDLKEEAPDSFATLQREARWLKAGGRVADIKPKVNAFADKRLKDVEGDKEKAIVYLNAGNVYMAAELFQEAEPWYRKLVEVAPNEYGALAAAMVGQTRFADALQLCSAKAEAGDTPRAAILLGRAYAAGKPTLADSKAAKALLDDAVSKHPEDIELLFTAGHVNMSAGHPKRAVELYERLLKLQPDNVAALNNLAAAMWELPQRRNDALTHIDQAIKLRGEQPALLDTKAMVLLESDADQAVELLEEITSIGDVDPRFYLHLAAAYQRDGSPSKAQLAVQKASDNDLAAYALTRTEQQLLDELNEMIATP